MLPSVTQILAPWADFSRINPEVLENAARRGSEVHRLCEAHALGLWIGHVPDDCSGYLASFRRWFDSAVESVVLTEPELADQENGYCGHPDLICRMKGDTDLALPDYKTPSAKSPSWRVQLAAYRNLAVVNGYEVVRVFSLRLRQDGARAMVDEYTGSFAHDMHVFLCALRAWKFFNNKE